MIVLEDRQLVIITPPHTASGNLHRVLCGPEFGGFWAIGPTPDGAGYDHHVAKVAEGWKSFRIAVVVRHPLDRLIGLYQHHQNEATIHQWEPVPWSLWVAMVLEKHPDISWFYRTTITALVGDTRIDSVIRYESLDDDLAGLFGERVTLPARQNFDRDWSEFLTQINVCVMAEWWGRDDMERFKYTSKVASL